MRRKEDIIPVVLNKYISIFYFFEILFLYLPDRLLGWILIFIPDNFDFAKRIAGETLFENRAYPTAIVIALSYIVTPLYSKIIVDKEDGVVFWRNLNGQFISPWKAILAAIFFTAMAFATMYMTFGDPGYCKGCTTSNKLVFFLFYGVIIPYLVSYTWMMGFLAIKYLFSRKR